MCVHARTARSFLTVFAEAGSPPAPEAVSFENHDPPTRMVRMARGSRLFRTNARASSSVAQYNIKEECDGHDIRIENHNCGLKLARAELWKGRLSARQPAGLPPG